MRDTDSLDRLELRRQFFLGPRLVKAYQTWQQLPLKNGSVVCAHPDLELTQVKKDALEVTLLGFLLDPHNIALQNKQILENLAEEAKKGGDITQLTHRFGGRWILIACDNHKTFVFNDPCGYRQIYYTTPEVGSVWCASQPKLLTDVLQLAIDTTAQEEFVNSTYVKNAREYWWPGDGSVYQHVKHLLPNHQLELGPQKVSRFWPRQPIRSISLDEGADAGAEFLENLTLSAAARFPLALPLTAGLDSRMLLAAARKVRENIFFYTLIYPPLNRNSADIVIPAKVLGTLGLTHHIIDCPSEMEPRFAQIYHSNVPMAHKAWGAIANGLLHGYPQDHVCLKAVSSEIARCRYYRYSYPKTISGKSLAALTGFGDNGYATRAFDDWLGPARQAEQDYGYKILDLFHWEQRLGNWQAMSQLEWDIVQEEFAPYNSRALLETLLAVNMKYRGGRTGTLFTEIIKRLWPDVLCQPINPMSVKGHLRHIAKTIRGKLANL